jgi:ABC-type multidrug transport system fused ATPase/permease subunit
VQHCCEKLILSAIVQEMLSGIRIVKFMSWEQQFLDRILGERLDFLSASMTFPIIIFLFFFFLWCALGARALELKRLGRYVYTTAGASVLWYGTPLLVSCATFFTYAFLANRPLDPATAFTALSLFNMLRHVSISVQSLR